MSGMDAAACALATRTSRSSSGTPGVSIVTPGDRRVSRDFHPGQSAVTNPLVFCFFQTEIIFSSQAAHVPRKSCRTDPSKRQLTRLPIKSRSFFSSPELSGSAWTQRTIRRCRAFQRRLTPWPSIRAVITPDRAALAQQALTCSAMLQRGIASGDQHAPGRSPSSCSGRCDHELDRRLLESHLAARGRTAARDAARCAPRYAQSTLIWLARLVFVARTARLRCRGSQLSPRRPRRCDHAQLANGSALARLSISA